jgi:formamidopyrimidine-DNA glycosylase
MPELPEVETTRRGLETLIVGRSIERMRVRERRLRWPIRADVPARLRGQVIDSL